MSALAIVATIFIIFIAVSVVGVVYVLRKRKRFISAMQAGMAEGSASPGNASAPRGAGGYTAAETTAMANHMLNAFPSKSSAFAPAPPTSTPENKKQ